MTQEILAIAIFIIVYISIIFNILPRSIIALAGAFLLVLLKVLSPSDIVHYINWEAIGLIFGMFILVHILKESGFFDFLSVLLLRATKGSPLLIILYFALFSGVLAAFIDSITVMLFMASLSIEISKKLKISPIPLILSQITAANIGGSATMVGDPPNIIIGTGLGFTFIDFVSYLAPISFFVLILNTLYFVFIYKKKLLYNKKIADDYIKKLDPKKYIQDKHLMITSLISFIITIFLLTIHNKIGLSVAYVGLLGGSLALILSGKKMENIWNMMDWEVLIFFATLFIIIGGLEKVGTIKVISNLIVQFTAGSSFLIKGVLLWTSSLLSGVIDNVPFASSMVPIIQFLSTHSAISLKSMAFITAFGTDIGGNFTPIGASANVVGLAILARAGAEVDWGYYLKVVAPITFINIVTAGIFFLIFYR